MNIFSSDNDPVIAARNLDKKRMVKMVLETAQILSTAIWTYRHAVLAKEQLFMINQNQRRNPCVKWATQSQSNYKWLLEHFKELSTLYSLEYQRLHKCHSLLPLFEDTLSQIPDNGLTAFPECFGKYKIDEVNNKSGIYGARTRTLKGGSIVTYHLQDLHTTKYKTLLLAKWSDDKIQPQWSYGKPDWVWS